MINVYTYLDLDYNKRQNHPKQVFLLVDRSVIEEREDPKGQDPAYFHLRRIAK